LGAAREWLEVAEEIQREVVAEFGLPEARGLSLLRTSRFPELARLSVYRRENQMRDGDLRVGEVVPDVELLEGTSRHSVLALASLAPLTVLAAGSLT
jgi:hypothetical protein